MELYMVLIVKKKLKLMDDINTLHGSSEVCICTNCIQDMTPPSTTANATHSEEGKTNLCSIGKEAKING
jgi:hypothetical protein